MRAVERGNATSMFSWVGSDGWSARSLVSDGNERAVEGTISVQPQANDVRGFTDYFLGLDVRNNKRNPWFVGKFNLNNKCYSKLTLITVKIWEMENVYVKLATSN
ncbi:hypothetical protein ACJJTC_005638 [Scirpophaga incertulas]